MELRFSFLSVTAVTVVPTGTMPAPVTTIPADTAEPPGTVTAAFPAVVMESTPKEGMTGGIEVVELRVIGTGALVSVT